MELIYDMLRVMDRREMLSLIGLGPALSKAANDGDQKSDERHGPEPLRLVPGSVYVIECLNNISPHNMATISQELYRFKETHDIDFIILDPSLRIAKGEGVKIKVTSSTDPKITTQIFEIVGNTLMG